MWSIPVEKLKWGQNEVSGQQPCGWAILEVDSAALADILTET